MYYLIGYAICLAFTIGLLCLVFMLRSHSSKKIKKIGSVVILLGTLLVTALLTTFLPNKWTNILYYLGLLLGYSVVVIVVYIIVTSVMKVMNKRKGVESSEDRNVMATAKSAFQNIKSKVTTAKKDDKKEKIDKKDKKEKKQTTVKKATTNAAPSSKKQKGNHKSKTAMRPNKKQSVTSKEKAPVKTNKKPKEKKVQMAIPLPPEKAAQKTKPKKDKIRRIEDYEPKPQSKVSNLKKPEMTGFNRRSHKKK